MRKKVVGIFESYLAERVESFDITTLENLKWVWDVDFDEIKKDLHKVSLALIKGEEPAIN